MMVMTLPSFLVSLRLLDELKDHKTKQQSYWQMNTTSLEWCLFSPNMMYPPRTSEILKSAKVMVSPPRQTLPRMRWKLQMRFGRGKRAEKSRRTRRAVLMTAGDKQRTMEKAGEFLSWVRADHTKACPGNCTRCSESEEGELLLCPYEWIIVLSRTD